MSRIVKVRRVGLSGARFVAGNANRVLAGSRTFAGASRKVNVVSRRPDDDTSSSHQKITGNSVSVDYSRVQAEPDVKIAIR